MRGADVYTVGLQTQQLHGHLVFSMAKKEIKCMVVGDCAASKMSTVLRYITGQLPDEWTPTVYDNKKTEVTVDEDTIAVDIFAVAGQPDYDALRPKVYPGTDVFMVCFSVMNRLSISTVREKWVPEIREFSQHVPFILVGTKMDLRSDEQTVQNLWDAYQQKPITTAEGEQLAASVGAGCYMECSAKTGENVKETMEQMARLALAAKRHDRKSSTHCHIV